MVHLLPSVAMPLTNARVHYRQKFLTGPETNSCNKLSQRTTTSCCHLSHQTIPGWFRMRLLARHQTWLRWHSLAKWDCSCVAWHISKRKWRKTSNISELAAATKTGLHRKVAINLSKMRRQGRRSTKASKVLKIWGLILLHPWSTPSNRSQSNKLMESQW